MEGRLRPEGLTEEQFAEAERFFEVSEQAAGEELWRMCCLMATKKDRAMLGKTEFQMRDLVHRIGAIAVEAAINERRKKGGTTEVALPAPGPKTASPATITPVSSAGGRKGS